MSIIGHIYMRARGLLARRPPDQLELALPDLRRIEREIVLPAGYTIRSLGASDAGALLRLLRSAGFVEFNESLLQHALWLCVPGGCFGVEEGSGKLVATMMARHVPSERHPGGGRIDWLATDPQHRSKGLASAVAQTATNRLINIGYADIYVTTDDFRPAAVKVFLKLGFEPIYYTPQMRTRWEAILARLRRHDETGVSFRADDLNAKSISA